jgi:SpoVK/Ycf46/Vps4 family AAA+-type ATPase
MPLLHPELFSGKLVQPTKGILLYGRPGCGKTLLAKALAKESQAVFLPLQLSKILNKWVGESNKLIAAAFSLAHKLQPAIIFIDELDTFLKANNSETAYLDSIKAEFLVLWDGIATSGSSRVLVLGATNKPQTIDPAILRRMPRSFHVPLPDVKGRLSILTLLFGEENVDPSVPLFLPELATRTEGYSGSDLKELCKAAAMVGVQERTAVFAEQRVMGKKTAGAAVDITAKVRPITKEDLEKAMGKVQKTGEAAHKYGREESKEENASIDKSSVRDLSMLLQALSGNGARNPRAPDDGIPNL